MSFSNIQKIETKINIELQQGWYNAILLRHIEKTHQNVPYTFVEFQIDENFSRVWAVFPHQPESMAKLKRLKQAIGMNDQETDLKPYYKKRLQIFIERVISEGKAKNEVSDFANFETKDSNNKTDKTIKMTRQILIVDDQQEVATLIGNYVRQLGFIPIIVSTVDEALKDFDPDKYLMVISDVIMPGKNGFDVVRYMHNKHPQVSVALMSGYFDKEMQNLQKVFGIEKVYRKPVFFSAIKEMIANTLQKMNTNASQ